MNSYTDIERSLEMDFLRATEIAALNTLQWLGIGDKASADAAACDAIRGMFDLMDIRGTIVIGEGIKDEAPGLFIGEKVGKWREGAPRFDIALDPVDGTTNCAKGMPNSLSCIAATGISTGPLLKGVQVEGAIATRHSVLMRARSGTVRFVEAQHNLAKKTIHLRSTQAEQPV